MTLPAFAVVPAMNAGAWFAQQQPPGGNVDGGGQGEDFGKSSPVGLLLLLLFLVAVAFLVRSMTKHLKRIPASFDEPVESDSTRGTERQSDGGDDDIPAEAGTAGDGAGERRGS
ncbi:hypothetical protein [Saccharomonospora viridis]|jgi:hypothetical protein|uniref:Uncharacterized protein n=2 Tax=Saccharomonospora viridis TaxID=1852 RepID=C7MYR2_SACVD|nr:hypothetical protein [Saccharomonospora viridis]ACU98151.1 hypothetical protein Svir_31780 [Saccharomonospora viridis DSM 43017]KHF46140.1 hypothetical protein MINT15_04410 [Saccharomonospora viridis]SFP33953.1 hypothetical protein SAMN02982918_1953 [Saccharomonospora viridis]